jgi:hypothetical protein
MLEKEEDRRHASCMPSDSENEEEKKNEASPT